MKSRIGFFLRELVWFLPLVLCVSLFVIKSINFPLHDFANYYFAAKAGIDFQDSSFIYNIYLFNSYAWSLGYSEVLIDFYINTPFTLTFFSPFVIAFKAITAKLIFNLLSSLLFISAIYLLLKSKLDSKQHKYFLLISPVVFFVPIRNQILFGQSYFLIFSFIVFALYLIEKKQKLASGFFLVVASLLKIFPVIYGILYLVNKKYKALIILILICISLIALSVWQTGIDIWKVYLTDVLPTTSANHSGVGFQFNAQSMSVFLKTLFVKDIYYNPNAIYNSFAFYAILTWIYKTIVLAVFIQGIWEYRKEFFKLFVILTTCFFLLQDRIATYTQILWLIPLIFVFQKQFSIKKKYLIIILMLLVCNIPLNWIENLPVIFKFSRMWLTLLLSIVILTHFIKKIKYKYILIISCISIPICTLSIINHNPSKADYVLKNKDYFIISDYWEENGYLTYNALGINGEVEEKTNIKVNSINEIGLEIINNQVYLNEKQVTFDNSLKVKPKLINDKEIYFLSDYNTRIGQYTLRKIAVE